MKQENEIMEFSSNPFWKVFLAYFVFFLLSITWASLFIAYSFPSTPGMQILFVVLFICSLALLWLPFQSKDSKKLTVNISQNEFNFDSILQKTKIENLQVNTFILNMLRVRIIVLNNKVLVIFPYKKNPYLKANSKQILTFVSNVIRLKAHTYELPNKPSIISRFIPYLFNIAFYFILVMGTAIFIFAIWWGYSWEHSSLMNF